MRRRDISKVIVEKTITCKETRGTMLSFLTRTTLANLVVNRNESDGQDIDLDQRTIRSFRQGLQLLNLVLSPYRHD